MMISMTAYWQLFEDCINHLPARKKNSEYMRQIKIAKSLSQTGVKTETLGITEIKGVANRLFDIAQAFNNPVTYPTKDKDYSFNLPRITSNDSLIFAIVYYEHLNNYRQVEYQGNILSFFRSWVISAVEEKKEPTSFQALAMLEQIKLYCQKQNIPLDETQIIRGDKETAKAYIERLAKQFIPPPEKIETIEPEPKAVQSMEIVSKALQPLSEHDEVKKYEKEIKKLHARLAELHQKADDFDKKIHQYHVASKNYYASNQAWQKLSWLKQCYYWIKSWFFPVEIIEELKKTTTQYNEAEKALHNDIHGDEFTSIEFYQSGNLPSPEEWERHRHELKYHAQQTQKEYEQNKQRIQQIKLQQIEQSQECIQQQLQQVQKEKGTIEEKFNLLQTQFESSLKATKEEMSDEESTDDEEAIIESFTIDKGDSVSTETRSTESGQSYYSFFNDYMPSTSTLGHIGVGLAAVAVQQFYYG